MHAGAIRALLYNNANLETPYNVTVADLTHAIAELRDTVGGVTTSAHLAAGCSCTLAASADNTCGWMLSQRLARKPVPWPLAAHQPVLVCSHLLVLMLHSFS